MGLFDLFKQNNFSELEKQGGMKTKYEKLIENIESLAKENFFSEKNWNIVELNHKMISKLIKQNEYVVQIIFQREKQISVYVDTFKLIHKKGTITFKYSRESKSLLPIMPSVLPPVVKLNLDFKNTQNQDLILINLLNSIEVMFNKDYNFSDYYFKERIKELRD
jgi:hypothetical protein